MSNYEPITFGKLSEAIAYLEGGGELFVKINDAGDLTNENIGKVSESELCLYGAWKSTALYTKAKPAPWYEKLDGTVENGVLCMDENGRTALIVERYLSSNELIDEWGNDIDISRPLTRAEIQRFMDNAPEEV